MALGHEHSFTITLNNNRTEKAGFDLLLGSRSGFFEPNRAGRKRLLDALGLSYQYARAFDLIKVPSNGKNRAEIQLTNTEDLVLIELKTTRKKLPDNPKGFFFGATQNEIELATKLGWQYKFCFVCLHHECTSFKLLTLSELTPLIKSKRVQFQINL